SVREREHRQQRGEGGVDAAREAQHVAVADPVAGQAEERREQRAEPGERGDGRELLHRAGCDQHVPAEDQRLHLEGPRGQQVGRPLEAEAAHGKGRRHLRESPRMKDQEYMQRALALAKRAQDEGEVPIGALVVFQDQILGEGWNRPIAAHDPTAHAEIQAMRAAAAKTGNYRLTGATLYVTLEPCEMCLGAMFHARVARLVYGATDPKKLVLKSTMTVERGVLAEECGAILSKFFAAKR